LDVIGYYLVFGGKGWPFFQIVSLIPLFHSQYLRFHCLFFSGGLL
jgi:hypothetical protein